MSMQYKAYLYEIKPGRSKEIRRFAVDGDVCSNYEYLRKKVASVFPSLNENFSLQWSDNEGDMIWFNSDEELLHALSQHTPGEIFKLYVKEHIESKNKEKRKDDFSQWQSQFGSHGSYNYPFSCHSKPSSAPPTYSTFQSPLLQKQEPSKFQDSGSDYLKHMGNAVADLLQPFGIDVDINVEHRGERSKCSGTQPATSEQKRGSSSDNCGQSENNATEQKKQDKDDHDDSSDPEWTFVKADEKDQEKKAATSEVQTETYEGQNTNGPNDGFLDARHRTSFNQLLAMGFTNQGGWLANMVKFYNGDIEKILDALQPSRSRNN